MAKRRRKQGRPRAVPRVWIEVVRRPEDEIDRHALALALIDFYRKLEAKKRESKQPPDDLPRKVPTDRPMPTRPPGKRKK
ncbi:hypothetical protein [Bifidobacterium tibiigranuli]|jgi:hypothetical protein|uniref:hypothetical protein n=1 Tax=Bifidobacterium tibiigranuli TaxID=2172043 RepID=UPI0026F3500E|nr:hypothetical protein [Bifidobacterium tibiigranuli]MCI1712659.1 hypothetical protein [Bifidobacterium tibiigranuli]